MIRILRSCFQGELCVSTYLFFFSPTSKIFITYERIYLLTIVKIEGVFYPMKQNKSLLSLMLILVFLVFTINGVSLQQEQNNSSEAPSNQDIGNWVITVEIMNLEETMYKGNLKVYIVEPVSRYHEAYGTPYRFGFLDFAYNKEIEVDDVVSKEISWNPYFIGNVDKDNIMVIAVLFNEHSEVRYSNPDNQQRPFDGYFTDAAAAATPQNNGYNRVTDTFTHTVFVEKGSASGCGPCTRASEALSRIFSSNDYPFYYVNMVADQNTVAHTRLRRDFNLGSYPTTYVDGGYLVQVGSPGNIETLFRSHIQEAGKRDVSQVNLSVSLTWDPDVYPPMISITKPVSGLYITNEKIRDMSQSVVIGAVTIEVEAFDEFGINRVEFFVNGELRSTDTFYPYRFRNWKEPGLFGRYTIRAVAYNTIGISSTDEIQVIRFF